MGVVLTQVNQPGCPLAGPGARRCFRLLPVKDFHIWLSVGAWAFLVATSALWVSAAKKILSSICHTRSKSNVFEEGRLPVFAAP